jgi:hypothetical protein
VRGLENGAARHVAGASGAGPPPNSRAISPIATSARLQQLTSASISRSSGALAAVARAFVGHRRSLCPGITRLKFGVRGTEGPFGARPQVGEGRGAWP